MSKKPKEQPQQPQPQQRPVVPPIPDEGLGRSKGDGKKKKAIIGKQHRLHLTEEEWSLRLPGNR